MMSTTFVTSSGGGSLHESTACQMFCKTEVPLLPSCPLTCYSGLWGCPVGRCCRLMVAQ